MPNIFTTLVLMSAEASLPTVPADNIFKAHAKTPIIEQAISEFQDICPTFMLHESAVSKSDDLKHFNSKIEASGYVKRSYTSMEQAAASMGASMGVFGDSFFTPFTKDDDKFDLRLRWKQSYEHSRIGQYSKSDQNLLLKMPYGKNNGLSCGLTVQLPKDITISDIQAEILKHDSDWLNAGDPENEGLFTEFNKLQPSQYYSYQHVDFEQSSFTFSVSFEDPKGALKTTRTGEPNPYYDESSNPNLTFIMRRP